ncbi:type I-F CRISPR-associated protein Csy3 [Hahella aquimaris]|uniref:type I-F CRISPR-associated protein Csy3 n=1 Tax=Hahella sp. HNIBRBA332 TaxID=3015983 RepID=UPI00273B29C4|nr:type I-F CRISPR-associated protein Csy3 [Hahella sp. HNIBRBA332]WLQ14265.1 type I-F CRISPR-associated protein Csy3 [Hahella sp. HNIBRBA332]
MTHTTFNKLPAVLSFQRGVMISDALFFNRLENGDETQLMVVRHGIRGTQNVNSDAKKEVSNIQITESAKTSRDAVGVSVKYDFRAQPLSWSLFACAGEKHQELKSALDGFIDRATTSEGLQEVARRYARNILNGRWLWRNRMLGASVRVKVSEHASENVIAEVDSLSIPLHHFDQYSKEETTIGSLIAENLSGKNVNSFLVTGMISLGFKGAVEVYPSQNYIESKPRGFARSLYKLGVPDPVYKGSAGLLELNDIRYMGQASLRDQKVGNALRTIDTWYPEYDLHQRPIPVEPHGANLDAQAFFRREGAARKASAFELLKRISLLDPNTDDGMFMIASLIRGGVFGESENNDSRNKAAK